MSLYSDRVKITVNFNGSLGFRCSLLAEGERLPLPHRERPFRRRRHFGLYGARKAQ